MVEVLGLFDTPVGKTTAMSQTEKEALEKLHKALLSLTYNGHHATGISEGKHFFGFCRTCADQHVACQEALVACEKAFGLPAWPNGG